jgi:hypothetical protein
MTFCAVFLIVVVVVVVVVAGGGFAIEFLTSPKALTKEKGEGHNKHNRHNRQNQQHKERMKLRSIAALLSIVAVTMCYQQFCRCQCEANYAVIPLEGGCGGCTRQFCIGKVDGCGDSQEQDFTTSCFRKLFDLPTPPIEMTEFRTNRNRERIHKGPDHSVRVYLCGCSSTCIRGAWPWVILFLPSCSCSCLDLSEHTIGHVKISLRTCSTLFTSD